MSSETPQDHYKDLASDYDSLEETPQAEIGREMVQYGLGDCSGKLVLDVGGGTGLRARDAVALGAKRVDLVDLSHPMMKVCEEQERKLGREPGERVACYEGNCFGDLEHVPLARDNDGNGLYDIVMIIWTFDHAANVEELTRGWKNVGRHCRPGGKVISLGITNPLKQTSATWKYGVEITNVGPIEGGAKFTYNPKTSVPYSCDVEALEAHYDLDQTRAIAKKFGIKDLEFILPAEMPMAKKDPEFWQAFVDNASFYCVQGRKEE